MGWVESWYQYTRGVKLHFLDFCNVVKSLVELFIPLFLFSEAFLFLFQFCEGLPSQLALHRQLSNSVPPPTTESSVLLPSPRQGESPRRRRQTNSTNTNHKILFYFLNYKDISEKGLFNLVLVMRDCYSPHLLHNLIIFSFVFRS